jgi:hypothetical protein
LDRLQLVWIDPNRRGDCQRDDLGRVQVVDIPAGRTVDEIVREVLVGPGGG